MQHTVAGNSKALGIATGIAAWTHNAIEGVIAKYGLEHWQQVLSTEWGGMNEVGSFMHLRPLCSLRAMHM
eukprot:SAG11_NODE_2101_length_3821_cov_1.700699_4_plen_70_part_00